MQNLHNQILSSMQFLYFFFISTFLLLSPQISAKFVDLEKMKQDFILESKQIYLHKYPDAFNPSIVRWDDSILVSFRARDPKTQLTTTIGLTFVDKNFNPYGKVYILKFPKSPLAGKLIQDPRLITISGRLYMVYSNTWKLPAETVRRVFIAKLEFNGQNFIVKQPEPLLKFESNEKRKFEKNWVPFEYQGQLFLSYSLNPHKILEPIFGHKSCKNIATTKMKSYWQWGELRGGTPALITDEGYLAFFHTSKDIKSIHSQGKCIPHYFMGAYLFEKTPPFAIKKISRRIIVGENFYKGKEYETWKPLRVVFPCGYIFDENFIWITFGRQDNEMWMVKIDKQKLFESLVPVETVKSYCY